ncbi:MAG: winged helix-turn-helix transcriptional regulator, partial [Candidatus Thorarchaeota archaeon]|nr:winged helix-turn-helix transcriptional regulator [Candidatus Thorarchaeota archaeon]
MERPGKGRKPLSGLDRKDLHILSALGRLGGNVSAEELAQITGYKPRTIRYRLKRLRDEGYLTQLYAMTHEVKFGMGDSILILNEAKKSEGKLQEALKEIPWFYYQGSTYGRYTGYIIHSAFSTHESDGVTRVADALEEVGLIDQYHYFVNTDYESRRGDFRYFEFNKGWNWDCSQWIHESEGCIASGNPIEMQLDENQTLIEFDKQDLELMNELKIESNRTLGELGTIVGLSEGQVKRRITRMEDTGIIKGYRWILNKVEQPLFFYIFMELSDNIDCVLSSFYRLPFPSEIMMESRNRYVARIRLYGTEITD